MRYRTIGSEPSTRRDVSVLSLGAMLMGSRTDEATSLAILDRFVEAGGTFIDTSGNYAFWVHGTQGGESEELLGRWRRSRGIGDEIVIATKVGARPLAPSAGFARPDGSLIEMDGLSAKAISDVIYAEIDVHTGNLSAAGWTANGNKLKKAVSKQTAVVAGGDVLVTAVPLSETVEGFAELVAVGMVGLLGVSNTWSWRVERARSLAAAAGLPGYEVLQYSHTYLRRRADAPSWLSPDGEPGAAGPDLLSYVRFTGLPLVAYSPLLGGAYVRPDKPLGPEFDHAGTPRRLAAEIGGFAGSALSMRCRNPAGAA